MKKNTKNIQLRILISLILPIFGFNVAIATENQKIDSYNVSNKIGDYKNGGIVFYVDETGKHGLIASLNDLINPEDSSGYISWDDGKHKFINATKDGVNGGAENTSVIVEILGEGNYAAKLAADFSVRDDGVSPCLGTMKENCYKDWYLPSKYELNLLFNKKVLVKNLTNDCYWSSTESSAQWTWSQDFGTGRQIEFGKSLGCKVRVVRGF